MEKLWPGAYERGLQSLPPVAAEQGDLSGPREQCWMNLLAAQNEKGAPLSKVEEARILRGRPWKSPRARIALARARGVAPPFTPDEIRQILSPRTAARR